MSDTTVLSGKGLDLNPPPIRIELEWISVNARLPRECSAVLTINKDGVCMVCHIEDENEGEWYLGYFGGALRKNIEYWMPLPPNPKEQGDEG